MLSSRSWILIIHLKNDGIKLHHRFRRFPNIFLLVYLHWLDFDSEFIQIRSDSSYSKENISVNFCVKKWNLASILISNKYSSNAIIQRKLSTHNASGTRRSLSLWYMSPILSVTSISYVFVSLNLFVFLLLEAFVQFFR